MWPGNITDLFFRPPWTEKRDLACLHDSPGHMERQQLTFKKYVQDRLSARVLNTENSYSYPTWCSSIHFYWVWAAKLTPFWQPRQSYLLDPILTIALGGGPIKTMPSSASSSANLAFSLKNPYLVSDTWDQLIALYVQSIRLPRMNSL